MLNKPVVRRERRDSSDHEPSPPTSPGSFYPEDNTPSSITVSLNNLKFIKRFLRGKIGVALYFFIGEWESTHWYWNLSTQNSRK